jgi:SAM-dependent methyltransferase
MADLSGAGRSAMVPIASAASAWDHQRPPFDLVSWVLDVAGLRPGSTARGLDVGCGNGLYLARLRTWSIAATGCDLSRGMLAAARATEVNLVNADVTRLPFVASAFDVVLAPQMLYHVADRGAAASEIWRVMRSGGRCVVVTNGVEHMRSLRSLVESAVRVATPGWEIRNPSTHAFSLETTNARSASPGNDNLPAPRRGIGRTNDLRHGVNEGGREDAEVLVAW